VYITKNVGASLLLCIIARAQSASIPCYAQYCKKSIIQHSALMHYWGNFVRTKVLWLRYNTDIYLYSDIGLTQYRTIQYPMSKFCLSNMFIFRFRLIFIFMFMFILHLCKNRHRHGYGQKKIQMSDIRYL
jgi:hypothetical protein